MAMSFEDVGISNNIDMNVITQSVKPIFRIIRSTFRCRLVPAFSDGSQIVDSILERTDCSRFIRGYFPPGVGELPRQKAPISANVGVASPTWNLVH